MLVFAVFFFFKQKTAYEMRISDWSSDVCSSDLFLRPILHCPGQHRQPAPSCSVSKNGGQVPDIISQKLGPRPPKREHAFDPAFEAAFILFAHHQSTHDMRGLRRKPGGNQRVE